MFDTIKLSQIKFPVTQYGLKDYGWKQKKYQKFQTYILNAEQDSLPNLTAIATPQGWLMSSEGSLPKIIFGHNSKLPNQAEVNEGLQFISDYIEANTGIEFDIQNAYVNRIDYARDLRILEESSLEIIEVLSKRKLSNKNKLLFNDTSLYFNSKDRQMSDSTRIYLKLPEVIAKRNSNLEAVNYAKGILRIERIFKGKKIDVLRKNLGLTDRKCSTLLTKEISDFVLNETLKSLDYDQITLEANSKLILLLKAFKPKQSFYLFGFLEMVRIYGADFYKNPNLHYSKSTYYDNIKKLKSANLMFLLGK